MTEFCECEEFIDLQTRVFIKDPIYGWILSWVELTEETGYTQVHRYGRPITFCPICGKLLNKNYT